jgi:hypothetical protein
VSLVRFSILCAIAILIAMPVAAAETGSGPGPLGAAAGPIIASWQEATAERAGCVGDVSIRVEELDDRLGEYRAQEALVVVSSHVPSSRLPHVLIHELSHHIFVSCGLIEDVEFTTAFYAAQRIPTDRGWFDYSSGWAETPAELFAEAVTELLLGVPAPDVTIHPETLAVVANWLSATG